jgi:autotransporter-associated beta strand protein
VSVASGATLILAVGGSQQWTTANVNSLLAVSGLFSPGVNLGFDTNGGNFSLGSISNSGIGLAVAGSNRLTLTGSNNFSGVTNVSQGVLQLANPAALQGSTVAINTDNGVQFSPGIGTFNLGGLSGGNLLQLSDTAGGAIALVVGSDGVSTTFSGELTGNGSLTKTGPGSLVLSGSDSYSGGTTVDTGTLYATNFDALPNGRLSVGAGGTFIFDPPASAAPDAAAAPAASPSAAAVAVPEPGTSLLLAISALLATFAAWRRRRN